MRVPSEYLVDSYSERVINPTKSHDLEGVSADCAASARARSLASPAAWAVVFIPLETHAVGLVCIPEQALAPLLQLPAWP